MGWGHCPTVAPLLNFFDNGGAPNHEVTRQLIDTSQGPTPRLSLLNRASPTSLMRHVSSPLSLSPKGGHTSQTPPNPQTPAGSFLSLDNRRAERAILVAESSKHRFWTEPFRPFSGFFTPTCSFLFFFSLSPFLSRILSFSLSKFLVRAPLVRFFYLGFVTGCSGGGGGGARVSLIGWLADCEIDLVWSWLLPSHWSLFIPMNSNFNVCILLCVYYKLCLDKMRCTLCC